MIEITLSYDSTEEGALIGLTRKMSSMRRGQLDTYGLKDPWSWSEDIEGALGELAFCKAIGEKWPATVDTFKRLPDAFGCEVKTSRPYFFNIGMRARPNETGLFVFVTGGAPDYRIWGWMESTEAKQKKYWNTDVRIDRMPCYYVPLEDLHPIEELRAYRSLQESPEQTQHQHPHQSYSASQEP